MFEALIAVIGSLLGVVLGGVLAHRSVSRAQVSKALHESRISAFAQFAAAVMEYRRSLMERWYVENGIQATPTAADDVFKTRSAAWAALFRVQLLCGKAAIGQQARTAIDATSKIKDAVDRSEVGARANESRRLVEAFVGAARDDIAAGSDVK
ncbi:hypothetical protein MLP_18550 [Microlunatus phosphovorus NM-1]|uniref:Uncharacterized protein n=1 Tax=Microlunatus phosphovorus (strain ATCC 700054 / DSM 10555 / JCM 9379 / NBRC 101784 / NCIMB 13414 / VKM Ac-1990 / NM-1) TaxID=1032480 RepID=F5XSI8_MICPN|nr:hypothetical protein [Microlunatus phosphovorus]BAK34869.1 hypothetical protein MLP_18550 [Microlunatus phosphovorus NM-1]